MKTLKFYFIFLSVLLSLAGYSQGGGVSINSTNSPPDPTAMLDVSSTNKGTLITRLTTAQRDSIINPAFGLLIFNTTTACFNMWNGAGWRQLCGDCDFSSPVAGNNGPVCVGQTLNLTAASISGATYLWWGPNGFTSTQQNLSIANASTAASGAYSVVATLNGCSSSTQTTFATVNTYPATPAAGNNGPLCVGQTLNLTSSTVAGASYSWTGPNGYSSYTQNPVISNAQAGQAGTYYLSATLGGCSSSDSTSVSIGAAAGTGGNITTFGNYTIHTFTDSGTFTPSPCVSSVEILIVASGGGGGGGNYGAGGGGAGGLIYKAAYPVTTQPYKVTVGDAGTGGTGGDNGDNGGNSIFDTLTAIGGGGGVGGGGTTPLTGGSGGGASYNGGSSYSNSLGEYLGAAGTSGQGNAGGGGRNYSSGAGFGGGGGAGAVGGDCGANDPGPSGSGGDGLQYSISGTATYYAGGGGGSSGNAGGDLAGSGGLGGGGAGGQGTSSAGAKGGDNTGGGGGGGVDADGGNGGSGIVIIRYLTP